MVSATLSNPTSETNRSGGRDTSTPKAEMGSEATPAKPMSKALRSAIARRDMMVQAGASQESIDIMDARIERLTPKTKPEAPVEDSVAKLQRLIELRYSWLNVQLATGQIEGAQEYAEWCINTPLSYDDKPAWDWTKDIRDAAEVAA